MEDEESAARSHFENLLSSPEGSDMLNKTMTSLRTMIESHKKTLNNVHSSDEKVSLRLKFLYTLYVPSLSLYVSFFFENIHHTYVGTIRTRHDHWIVRSLRTSRKISDCRSTRVRSCSERLTWTVPTRSHPMSFDIIFLVSPTRLLRFRRKFWRDLSWTCPRSRSRCCSRDFSDIT